MWRFVVSAVGASAAAGIAVASAGEWVETSIGGFSGLPMIDALIAFCAVIAGLTLLLVAAGRPRFLLVVPLATAAAAMLLGLVIDLVVHELDRTTWLLERFAEGHVRVSE